jgi:hypothetical protein
MPLCGWRWSGMLKESQTACQLSRTVERSIDTKPYEAAAFLGSSAPLKMPKKRAAHGFFEQD